jgi:hypothetical protein
MKLRIGQRHFVHDETTLNSYNGIVDRTLDAYQNRPHIDFVMRVGYKPTATKKILDGLTKENKRLAEKGIKTVMGDLGPGDVWFSEMTDVIGFRSSYSETEVQEKPKGCITALVDGDQLNINDSNFLDGVDILSRRLLESDSLLGLGARDKVSLADTEELDNARKIDEMYLAIFMKNIKLSNPLGVDNSNAPRAYKRWGDPIPGTYLINNSCARYARYAEWLKLLWEDSKRATLTRTVALGDQIGVMEASTLEKEIPSVYVKTRGNPPGSFKMETINRKAFELGKTSIFYDFLTTVENSINEKELSKYFDRNQVAKVKGEIRNSLLNGSRSRHL